MGLSVFLFCSKVSQCQIVGTHSSSQVRSNVRKFISNYQLNHSQRLSTVWERYVEWRSFETFAATMQTRIKRHACRRYDEHARNVYL